MTFLGWQVVEIFKELSVPKITLAGGVSRKYELCTHNTYLDLMVEAWLGCTTLFTKTHGGKSGLRASVLN